MREAGMRLSCHNRLISIVETIRFQSKSQPLIETSRVQGGKWSVRYGFYPRLTAMLKESVAQIRIDSETLKWGETQMHVELQTRRRVIIETYRRYLEADRDWSRAAAEARAWFPIGERTGHAIIGNPGSPVRGLYDRRVRAIQQLETAMLKFKTAKLRMLEKQRCTRKNVILMLN